MMRYPSLDHLRTFHVAAQFLSFKQAADALNVTPAAIGQRIKTLEDQLQIKLFDRQIRAIVLTEKGRQLFNCMTEALSIVDSGLKKIKPHTDQSSLTISTTPVFAERYLLHKLPNFNQQHPDINVRVIAESIHTNFDIFDIDLAIRFGHGNYQSLISTRLTNDVYLPICHPSIAKQISKTNQGYTLIHCDWETQNQPIPNWERWFNKHGNFPLGRLRNLSFTLESLAISAALSQQGVALAHYLHVEKELKEGKLVSPYGLNKTLTPNYKYHLLEPNDRVRSEIATKFKSWLIEEIRHAELSNIT